VPVAFPLLLGIPPAHAIFAPDGTRTLAGLRGRILARFCCLAAAITLNHQLGRPSRAVVNY
jgi:hypothetical protein